MHLHHTPLSYGGEHAVSPSSSVPYLLMRRRSATGRYSAFVGLFVDLTYPENPHGEHLGRRRWLRGCS